MIALPFAHDPPLLRGQLRVAPEDFQVRELINYPRDGTGEHAWLWVRKCGANTDWVAKRLAERAGVAPGAVSYAGLKDRHAVTEQWFSVHLPGKADPDWSAIHPDFTVLEVVRHSRKLRRGALSSNLFRITIRDLAGDPAALATRWQLITTAGVPHYFGEQRFGHDAGNLLRAEAMLGGTEPVRDRHQRGLYLSAARSALFNAVLSRRITEGTWNQLIPGDVLMLAGSHSIFPAGDGDDVLRQRVADFDLHPTGPLWGAGELLSSGTARALEEAVAAEWPIFRDGLPAAGLRQERRALRLLVTAGRLELSEPGVAVVEFQLPAGAYATTVLRELVQTTDG